MKCGYTKPYVNPEVALDTLEERGLKVPDRAKALVYLNRVGYYRMSGYWYPLRDICSNSQNRVDGFSSSHSFNDVIDFYVFDKEIRHLLADALERIEIAVRCSIVERLASISPFSYRDNRTYAKSFSKPTKQDPKGPLHEFLCRSDKKFRRSQTKEVFAKHFFSKYQEPAPIWMVAEVWDWGNMSFAYRNLRLPLREDISRSIHKDLNSETLSSWLRSLNDLRNCCAHHSRAWNRSYTNHPKFSGFSSFNYFDHVKDANGHVVERYTSRIYGACLAIRFLMRQIHPSSKWHERFAEHVNIGIEILPLVDGHSAGFPSGWNNSPLWIE